MRILVFVFHVLHRYSENQRTNHVILGSSRSKPNKEYIPLIAPYDLRRSNLTSIEYRRSGASMQGSQSTKSPIYLDMQISY